MPWTNDMSVGVPEIDEQHKSLFACLARVEDAIDEKQQGSAVFFALDQLADYARIHFAVEEIEMRIHRYPDFDTHVSEHRAFELRIKQFSEEALHRNVFGDVREFLKDWLVQHIQIADKAYAPYIIAGNTGAVASSNA
jgi:hemerythrin